MNAPFPPAGGPLSAPGSGAGDEPELRSLLEAEALRQPPVSSDLRAGVDRRVRRHRVRLAAFAAPVVALVLVGAVLLAPRSTPDATVATASEPTAQEGETPAPPATDEPAPEVVTPAPAANPDCGTVELGPDRLDPETGPLDCFIAAFNAGTDAQLVVLMHGPDGGTLTETITTAPGKQVEVVVDGSISIQLPSMSFGSGGGLVPADPEGGGGDCGTITVTEGTQPEQMDPAIVTCLIGLFTSGSEGGLTLVTNDATGGTMTVRLDVSASHLVTVTINGTLTQTLSELTIPSDLTAQLPPNGIGLDELGVGGLGGESFFPGHEKPGN
jgi:hypothetical protein